MFVSLPLQHGIVLRYHDVVEGAYKPSAMNVELIAMQSSSSLQFFDHVTGDHLFVQLHGHYPLFREAYNRLIYAEKNQQNT